MAQWLGQFTGRTHATAVRDAEQLLRHAVEQLRLASPAEHARKAKGVRVLAKRVYSARVRFLKASVRAAADPNTDSVHEEHARELDRLRAELARVENAAVEGVLHEFSGQGI